MTASLGWGSAGKAMQGAAYPYAAMHFLLVIPTEAGTVGELLGDTLYRSTSCSYSCCLLLLLASLQLCFTTPCTLLCA